MKNKFKVVYFYIGGAILITTVVTFLYSVLIGGAPAFLQWLAAVSLMGIGVVFMIIGNPES